jgi:hypothetical protein
MFPDPVDPDPETNPSLAWCRSCPLLEELVLEQTVLQLPDLLDTMDSIDSAHKPFVSTSLRRYAFFFSHSSY